jgi:plasmid segregation protein ParM
MFVVGVDVGYSNLKLAMGNAGETPRVLIRPAGAAPANRLGERVGQRAAEEALAVTVDGELWSAGIEPGRFEGWERSLHEDYPATPTYLALFKAALALTGTRRIDRLVTGLPVSQQHDPHRRDALRHRLCGTHALAHGEVQVREVHVLPQPVGAYIDVLFSTRGEVLDRMESGTVLVLDAGFYSFDWALIVGGELRRSASGSSLAAMSVLIEHVARDLCVRYGGRPQPLGLEATLRAGRAKFRHNGSQVALAPLMQRAAQDVARVALEALRQGLRRESTNIELVVIAGGGGTLYGELATELFPQATIAVAAEPVSANALGFFHYGAR